MGPLECGSRPAAVTADEIAAFSKAGARLPHSISEKRAGQSAESAAQARAERTEESAGSAGSVGACVQEFRGNAEAAREQVGIGAIDTAESLQRGHLALKSGVGKIELI